MNELGTIGFGAYEALVAPGRSKSLVISISGLGDLEKNVIYFESAKTINEALPDHHVIYLRDNSRSWYTNTDGWNALVEFVADYITASGVVDTTVLGLSMGGFGAIRLPMYVPVQRVVALSPRTVLGREGNFDRRNRRFFEQTLNKTNVDVLDFLQQRTDYTVVFSIDDLEDTLHAGRLRRSNVQILCCRGEHNIAHGLKEKSQLVSFLRDAAIGTLSAGRYCLTQPRDETFELAERYASLIDTTSRIEYISGFEQSIIPEYAFKDYLYAQIFESRFRNNNEKMSFPAHCSQEIVSEPLKKYLGHGWYNAEHFGAWGEGTFHILDVQLMDISTVKKAKVHLEFQIFSAGKCPHIDVLVFVNGRQIFDIDRYTSTLTVEFITMEKYLNIIVETPHSYSPEELGESKDTRKLSVAITKIKFSPA